MNLSHVIVFLCIAFCFLLSSCSSHPQVDSALPTYVDMFADDAFTDLNLPMLETPAEIFAIDEKMQTLVANELIAEPDVKKRTTKLIQLLFSNNSININYASGADLTAIDSFYTGQANCMSLTILAYVLAKEARLDAYFQEVNVPEFWQQSGQQNLLTGHVNLLIKRPKQRQGIFISNHNTLTVDFDPNIASEFFSSQEISKNTMLAMFYNNKGAHALAAKNYVMSYRYLKKSLEVDTTFSPAWTNLGILYKFNGLEDLAEYAYQYAMLTDDDFNANAASNLAILYQQQNKTLEALTLENKVKVKRVNNPYYHLLLANKANTTGDSEQAISHYKKALFLDDKIHTIHFALAQTYVSQGQITLAKKHLRKAIEVSTSNNIKQQYLLKLKQLNQ